MTKHLSNKNSSEITNIDIDVRGKRYFLDIGGQINLGLNKLVFISTCSAFLSKTRNLVPENFKVVMKIYKQHFKILISILFSISH